MISRAQQPLIDPVLGAMVIAGGTYVSAAGTITTAASVVTSADVGRAGNITIAIYGTYAGVNVTFEGSPDGGTNWFPWAVTREDSGSSETTSGVLVANTIRAWTVSAPGFNRFRVRATAFTSGTANVIIAAGALPIEPMVGAAVRFVGNDGVTTSVASTVTTNTTLVAADARRVALTIYNESTATLFVLMGAGTESATVYTVQVAPGGYYEVPGAMAPLRAAGHWSAANGSARITAVT